VVEVSERRSQGGMRGRNMENIKEWKYGPGVKMNADRASYKLRAVCCKNWYLHCGNVTSIRFIILRRGGGVTATAPR